MWSIPACAEVVGRATVTADEAPIYRGQEVVGKAKKGDVLEITMIRGDWYGAVPANGWIHKKFVSFEPASAQATQKPNGTAPPAAGVKPEDADAMLKLLGEGPEGRAEAVRKVHDAARKARDGGTTDALGKQLAPVLEKLAALPPDEESSKVLDGTAEIFIFSRVATPNAAAFARNMMARKASENLPDPWSYGLRVARELRLKDEELKKQVLAALPVMPDLTLSVAVGYLGEHYAEDPEAARKVASLLNTTDKRCLRTILHGLGAFNLDADSARRLVGMAVQSAGIQVVGAVSEGPGAVPAGAVSGRYRDVRGDQWRARRAERSPQRHRGHGEDRSQGADLSPQRHGGHGEDRSQGADLSP